MFEFNTQNAPDIEMNNMRALVSIFANDDKIKDDRVAYCANVGRYFRDS